jgi:hypothetical protein
MTQTKDESSDDAPTSSMAVIRAGTALSRDVLQELATTVATTTQREKLRKVIIGALAVGGIGAAVIGATGGSTLPMNIPVILFAVLCIAPILPLTLLWGIRNRALLNAAAKDAAVDHAVLAAAVRLMQKKKLGPSTALRLALQGRRDVAPL